MEIPTLATLPATFADQREYVLHFTHRAAGLYCVIVTRRPHNPRQGPAMPDADAVVGGLFCDLLRDLPFDRQRLLKLDLPDDLWWEVRNLAYPRKEAALT